MKENRNNSYDLLRIVSCIAVVLCHVNYLWFDKIVLTPSNSYLWIIESFINIVVRFCVPCFVMLSGAMLLSNSNNKDFKEFYSKRLSKILFPTFVIGFPIYIYSVVISRDFASYSKSIITGEFYNYWYIYMTIGLYLLTPIIIRIKETLTNKQFVIGGIVLFVYSIISQLTTTYMLPYSVGVIFAFLSYFIFGNIIYENKDCIKINTVTIVLICLACIAITFIWRYSGHNNTKLVVDAYTNFFSPTIVIYSLSVFTLFTKLNIEKSFYRLAKYTLFIYLFHAFVYSNLYGYLVNIRLDEIVKIILLTVITFIGSFIFSIIYVKLSNFWFKKKAK